MIRLDAIARMGLYVRKSPQEAFSNYSLNDLVSGNLKGKWKFNPSYRFSYVILLIGGALRGVSSIEEQKGGIVAKTWL